MKKRIVSMMLAAMMALSVVGCGSKSLSNDYVTVKQYKGLEVAQVEEIEVTDEQVEQTIQSNLSAAAEKEAITDRAAESGDWVNIDYTGYVDDVAFEGGTAQGADLELGSGTFIGAEGEYAGFEDQIVGHNTGEEFDIQVKFSDSYPGQDVAGKVARFHIVLNEIYKQNTPELTDEWVASNSKTSKTADEYRKEIRKQIESSAETANETTLKSEIQEALLEEIDVKKYPEDAVEEQKEQMTNYYTQMAGLYGIELSEFITTYLQMTEDEFNSKVEESAQQTVAFDEAIKLIAKKQKLEPSEKEYKEKFEEYAEEVGADVDTYVEQVGEDVLKAAILREAVLDYLVDNCVQVEESDSDTDSSK